MPIVAEQYRFVAGVDAHARTHTLAMLDASSSRQIAAATFPATVTGVARAVSWLGGADAAMRALCWCPWRAPAPKAPSSGSP